MVSSMDTFVSWKTTNWFFINPGLFFQSSSKMYFHLVILQCDHMTHALWFQKVYFTAVLHMPACMQVVLHFLNIHLLLYTLYWVGKDIWLTISLYTKTIVYTPLTFSAF